MTAELREAAQKHLETLKSGFRENTQEMQDAKTAGDLTAYEYTIARGRMIYRQITEVEAAMAA
jgi:transcription elongation GreA/GreB family factor